MEEKMNANEKMEANLQERLIDIPTDDSLPASTIIQDQTDDADLHSTPRFIP